MITLEVDKKSFYSAFDDESTKFNSFKADFEVIDTTSDCYECYWVVGDDVLFGYCKSNEMEITIMSYENFIEFVDEFLSDIEDKKSYWEVTRISDKVKEDRDIFHMEQL